MSTWHNNCIECHSTAGLPEHDPTIGAYRPEVAELGIACEACHGPADEHIRANQDPRRRYRLRLTGEPDPTIINPKRLPAPASSEICGQCHSINVFKSKEIAEGLRFRPGGDLTETRMTLRISDAKMSPKEREHWPRLQQHLKRQSPTFLEERLWDDGMVRVSGREYTAMIESDCYLGGELSCLSCHSMHDPVSTDDQLKPRMETNEACTDCHSSAQYDTPQHTHHPAGSSAGLCYNCHMPYTTYGLLKGIRSHLIDSPTVASSLESGRPNACNLCHLDRSLEWAGEALTQWYGQDPVTLTQEQQDVSAAVLWTLTGDANQRALMAWHMGWEPAQQASGRDWLAAYLGHLLADPYSTVRYIAHRSLRQRAEFADLRYDYIAPPEQRSEARQRAIRIARDMLRAKRDRHGSEILIDAAGDLDAETLTRLSRQRNDRPVDLRE
jgi:hypothetical protein